MRLFQLVDNTGELRGLYNVTISEDKLSDDEVEQVLNDVMDLMEDEDGDAVELLLDTNSIERVFVKEVYC